MDNIRNFSIIAHVDHGKSTLSNRIIQICNKTPKQKKLTNFLYSMELERERGFTIKAQSVRLNYTSANNITYQLNFIDTPGHVDFSYEVSRSLAACEGALLLIDASQGVEAQTLANYHNAIEMNLKVITILNKIDLPTADPDRIVKEIKDVMNIDDSKIIRCSAKTGTGVIDVLEYLINNIPQPTGELNAPLQALIIDSWFDNYLGIVSLIRIKNGIIRVGDKIKIMSTGQIYNISHLGIFTPKQTECTELKCGEVGWITCAIKDISGAPVGDTITMAQNSAKLSLPGFKKVKPQVYVSLFPVNSNEYEALRKALGKLSLNDTALYYEAEDSSILGFGFRCGFLGLLHMEVIQERIKREYNLHLIITTPSVIYEVHTINKGVIYIDRPSRLPALNTINELREPIAECHILLPKEYLGNVMTLCTKKRGIQTGITYHDKQILITYEIPMSEIILDFFNQLKSISRGYASLNYSFKCFQVAHLAYINILINGKCIDALAIITHMSNALCLARKLVEKIKKLIKRQQFDIIIQASVNNHIVARSTVKHFRKDVTAKCYGGDVNRKKKLLDKQKEGKKRMKQIGNIKLTQEVFLAVLHVHKDNNIY